MRYKMKILFVKNIYILTWGPPPFFTDHDPSSTSFSRRWGELSLGTSHRLNGNII